MAGFVCLHITLPHYHHNADLSESIELLKCLLDTFCLEFVSKIKSILSIIFMQYLGLCVFSLPITLYDDCENTCTLSCYHHQIGSMTPLPLSRVRTLNNGMRCMPFLYYCVLTHSPSI